MAVIFNSTDEVMNTIDLLHIDWNNQSIGVFLLAGSKRINFLYSFFGNLIALCTLTALTWDLDGLNLTTG